MLGLGYEEVRGAAWDTAVLSRLQNVFPAFLKKTNCKKKDILQKRKNASKIQNASEYR
jgi:hypothetical protein